MAKLNTIVLNGIGYEIGSTGSGVTDSLKTSLLQIAEKVAYIDENGQDYYDALQAALYPPADLASISATYVQSGAVFDTDSLDSLKTDLVVIAHMTNGTTQAVTNYTLSGTLTEGTSIITASYGGKDTTFNVTVTRYEPITEQITWTSSGSNLTSSVIDARNYDVYWEVPFVSGATQLKEGATAESNCVGIRAILYSDAQATNLVGWWFKDTQEIKPQGTDANSPKMTFNVSEKVAPKGYYVKLYLARETNLTTFVDNGNYFDYMKVYANQITMQRNI